MAMCFTLIPMDYHHLKQKSLTFKTISLRRGDAIDNVFKVYRAKFADFTVSSHWMLLQEDTIYRNIFDKKFLSTDYHRNDRDVSLWLNQQYRNLYNEISKTSHIQ